MLLLTNKSKPVHKAAYQKVTFFRALELYNEANYSESIALLDSSLTVSLDPIIYARAIYWSAEVAYQLLNYNMALENFKDFNQLPISGQLEEYTNLNYNIAYTYFKQKQYENSIKYFIVFNIYTSHYILLYFLRNL